MTEIRLAGFEISDWPLVQVVADVLNRRHVEGWAVGGAVRDALLGRPVHDWDFTVECDALWVARETADRLGAAYYTLDAERETGRVVVRQADGTRIFLDFALRRGDSWVEDLAARDFTVNALALSLTPPGQLLDPLGGQADLTARRMRAVSEAAFRDDPVRILRCVRLASALGFEVEPQTAAWARRDAPRLEDISAERVRDELVRLLTVGGAAASLRRLDDWGALERVLPESALMKDTPQPPPHHWNVLEHTLVLLDALDQVAGLLQGQATPGQSLPVPLYVWDDLKRTLGPYRQDLSEHLAGVLSDERTVYQALKLAALLHDCGKPAALTVAQDGRVRFWGHERIGAEMAAARARALRLARVEVERVRVIVANHMRPQQLADAGLTARAAYRYFRDADAAGVDTVLLALADHLATHGPDVQPGRWGKRLGVAGDLLGGYFHHVRDILRSPPLVSGRDLIRALGVPPGPRVGELLEAIREAQAAGEIHTGAEALELARRLGG